MAAGLRARIIPSGPVFLFGLLATVILAAVFVIGMWTPTLFEHAPGGDLRVEVFPNCEDTLAFMRQDCFGNASATVTYTNGTSFELPLRSTFMGHNGEATLAQARASVTVHTDRGVWEREVFIIEGMAATVSISAQAPRTDPQIVGHDSSGIAAISGLFALLALLLTLGAGVWLFGGAVWAASFVRGFLIVWLLAAGGYAVVMLFLGALSIMDLIVPGILIALLVSTSKWIKANRDYEPANEIDIESIIADPDSIPDDTATDGPGRETG